MNKQEILQKLIAHYEQCVEYMPEEDWDTYLIDYDGIRFGICTVAYRVFQIKLSTSLWIQRHCEKDNTYWCKIPRDAKSRDEAIELLQKRIDIMKQEILIPE